MTSGAYLPPEGGFNGEYLGSDSTVRRNVNMNATAGMMNSNVSGAPAPIRPYLPAAGSGVIGYGMPAMEYPAMMAQDTWGTGYEMARGSGPFLSPNGGRQNPPLRQEPPVIQVGGPGLGLLPPDSSATLYVEGIPADCKKREAAHIFRPFIGFKEVRLVYKEGKVVQERLELLVGSVAIDLMGDFDIGIGRLVWRDALAAWILPVTFILEKDWCNTFGLFLLSPRDAAPILGIQEDILADWMTVLLHGLGPGYSLPWLVDLD